VRPEWPIGYHPRIAQRLVMKFTVPEVTESSPDVQSAVLLVYVADVLGTLPEGLDLMHSVEDNEFQAVASDYQAPYLDTGLDLIVPADGTGQYYEFDVTDLLLANMADDSDPLIAFRLQLGGDQQIDLAQINAYVIDTQLSAPQLVVTFAPEPGTLVLATLSLLTMCSSRRTRAA
jgi:hypothetical protein